MWRHLNSLILLCLFLLMHAPLYAQTIPEPLEPWKEWAAEPYAYRECALVPRSSGAARADYRCVWPGKLLMTIEENGGRFSQPWHIEQDADITLPGSRSEWPQNVKVNGRQVPVVEKNGVPSIRLEKGEHVISGQWLWKVSPSQISIPAQTAWWEVSGVSNVQRTEDRLMLQNETQEALAPDGVQDALGVRVFRKFIDGQIGEQEVRMVLTTGGAPRSVSLGPVIDPAKWAPISIDSPWPVRWQEDGRIRVQVQAGTASITLRLRCQENCETSFSRLGAPAPWPATEYWALQSNPQFRVVAWDAQTIDPSQAGAPDEWKSLPWVLASANESVSWSVKSRGDTDRDGAMVLSRTAWLDFSGKGWWVSDALSGPLPRAGRLNASPAYEMRSATLSGKPILVSGMDNKTGVELRPEPWVKTIDLNAMLRHEGRSGSVPIAGIEGEYSQVNWTVHMPSGYKVLFAPGADRAHRVWWNAWTLTQVLGVALLLILSWRWGGLRAALPAVLLVLLSYQTPGIPLWSWGFALGASLLAYAGLPEKLRRPASWARMLFIGIWLLLATAFAIMQVRAAMYPDWAQPIERAEFEERGNTFGDSASGGLYQRVKGLSGASAAMSSDVYDTIGPDVVMQPVPPAPVPPASAPMEGYMELTQQASEEMARAPFEEPVAAPPPPVVIEETGLSISAGPGAPGWQEAQPVTLEWQGPITHDDHVRLWIATPFWVSLGRWLSVVLIVLVGAGLLRRPARNLERTFRWPLSRKIAASLLIALMPLPVFAATEPVPSAEAVLPPQQPWMERLADATYPIPLCAPSCTSIERANISVESGRLIIEMIAHAQSRTALLLPVGADNSLTLQDLLVDGQSRPVVMKNGEQLWLMLDQGVSNVKVVFEPRAMNGALRFEQVPGFIEARDSAWSFSGISRNTLENGVIGWQRGGAPAQSSDESAPAIEVDVAPFVRVHRTLILGPKWEVQTRVERIAPVDGDFIARIPLIDGEVPSRDMPRNEDGLVEIAFSSGVSNVSWQSDLAAKSPLTLRAPASTHIEVWTVQAGSRFNVKSEGLPSIAGSPWSFQPIPGETLTLEVSEPVPVKGAPVAVDSAQLSHQWGPRGHSISMYLMVRATAASDLVINVPDGVQLTSVSRNDAPISGAKVENNALALAVNSGQEIWKIEWRSSKTPALWVSSEKFSIQAHVANLKISHTPGNQRWILATPGPGKSPAVAYWPWLIVLIVLAVLMGRWKHTPLSTTGWVLLGIGFSVAAPWKIALVGGWLVAVRARARYSEFLHRSSLFNLYQVFFVLWTLVAIGTLVSALPESLLATPDMRIFGQSGGSLTWFVDQVEAGAAWASASIISVPIWIYRLLMLAWCLWLAISAVNWLKEALKSWMDGGYWKKRSPKMPPPLPTQSPPQK